MAVKLKALANSKGFKVYYLCVTLNIELSYTKIQNLKATLEI